jgi:integrase
MSRSAQFPPPLRQHRTAAEKAAGKPGRARVRVRGQDVTLGVWGSPEAAAAYRRLVAQLGQTGTVPVASTRLDRPTVAEVWGHWLDRAAATYSPRGRELENHRLAGRPLLALYGPTAAEDFRARDLERVRDAMAAGTWQTPPVWGWCANVCLRRLVRIQTAWKWLEKEGLVPEGRHAHLMTVGPIPGHVRGVRRTPKQQPTSRADLDRVLPHIQEHRRRRPVAAMLEIQYLAGMRSCEVRLMRLCDLDREGGPTVGGVKVWLYRVRAEADKNSWREGHAPRIVALGPACQALLAPWIENTPCTDCYLFRTTRDGPSPYTACSYAHAVSRACEKAGVKIQAYGGRHSAKERATRAAGLDAARSYLGQESIAATDGYAAGIDLQTAAELAARLG